MLRTAGSLCLLAAVAWVLLHLVFGVAGGLLGLIFGLAWLLFRAALLLGAVYFVLALVAPETARKMRTVVERPPTL